MLKGQDVILLVLLRLRDRTEWTYEALSQALGISASQCHLAVHRLQKTGLLSKRADGMGDVSHANFKEYFIHALKYDFPAEIGPVMRGIPTVHNVSFIARNFFSNELSPDGSVNTYGPVLMEP